MQALDKNQLNSDCLAYWENVYLDRIITRAPDMHCSKHPEDINEKWRHMTDPTYVAPRRICTCKYEA
jgi:hypothetical protein